MKKLITLMIVALCAATLFAQVPEKFSYQAVVRNASNQLVTNAPVSVRVSILQGGADGTALYVETHTAVTNANGLLTLEIGGGKAEQGAFDRIDWASGSFFLKTETDPNGGSDYSITSVQQLLSVPYALYAKEAANGFSGDYNDLTNKPAIPQNVGELTNDAGYITLNDIPTSSKSGETNDAGVVQTTACGEIDLCDMASQLARLQAQFARQQAQMEETQTALLSTVDDSEPCPGTPTVKDIDGNVYNTVKIGEQCWMRENLRTTRYADGSPIPAGGSACSFTEPYYYDYPSSGFPLEKRGYLYNWPAVMHGEAASDANPSNVQGICPDGWHLPSTSEWTQLTDYVRSVPNYVCDIDNDEYGGSSINKALSATEGWNGLGHWSEINIQCYADVNQEMNNATGFSAIPIGAVGGMAHNGPIGFVGACCLGEMAFFWSSSKQSFPWGSEYPISFWLEEYWTGFNGEDRLGEGGDVGFSVRCLRGSATVGETSVTVPSVTTSEVSDVSGVTAVCGGEVTAEGGAEVTERGVCWGTEPNPTVEDSHTSDGTGTGEFVSTLTDLVPNTNYYVRAYATNSVGTVYGEVMSFTTAIIIPAGDAQPCPGNETVTDIDGNVYNTVKIGEQCWMKENLRVTHYVDGVEIPLESTPSVDVAFVYNPDDNANNILTHGYLYNWAAVMHGMPTSNTNPSNVQGVCPTGWHVPSDAEWTQLTDYVGNESSYWCGGNSNNIAKALAAQTGWNINNNGCTVGNSQDANNATGFSALPAGLYSGWGDDYGGFDDYADFWSATQVSNWQALLFHISNVREYVDRYSNDKYDGKSVRCVLGDGYNFAAVTTEEVTNVTLHGATCGGDVVYEGNTDVTERGVCWSTEPNPTVEDSHTSDGSGMGEFISTLTDLTPNTTYYVKAYATNSVGTAYGNEVSFTTAEEDTCTIISLPYTENFDSYTTTTTAATGVEPTCWELVQEDVAMTDANRPQLYYKSSYAHSGNYSLLLNYRGIYAMPVVSQQIPLNTLKMEMYLRQPRDYYQLQVGVWEDNGTFVPVATVHNASTGTEFVEVDFSSYTGDGGRIAFRNLNSNGNNYSYNYLDDITLSVIGGAVGDAQPCPGAETVTDYDGNVYNTVKIGEQCWMRENLRTTHYADGGEITNYYNYVNGDSNVAIYGYAYVRQEVMRGTASSYSNPSHVQGICPTGWHVPSSAEWTQLIDYVGSVPDYQCGGNSSNIAKALASTEGWMEDDNDCTVGNNQSANNASGFAAVPAIFNYYDEILYAKFVSTSSSGEYFDCFNINYNDSNVKWENEYGLNWGQTVSVRCLRDEGYPFSFVTTVPVSNVTLTSADCGGEVTADNGAEIIERGVCWGTEPSPTVGNNHTSSGSGTGTFTIQLSDLFPNTTYYVRAYATNSMGTSYGEEEIFMTLSPDIPEGDAQPCPGSETLTDYDGNIYNTVKIGEQCWMRENLRTTHYADGEEMHYDYHFDYPYFDMNNVAIYGILYHWPAVMHSEMSSNANPSGVQGVCPDGWHVPSDAEWTQLFEYMGSVPAYVCGGNSNFIAKSLASQSGWLTTSPNTNSPGNNLTTNNASGFGAIPAGCGGDAYFNFGSTALYWSTTGSYSYCSIMCEDSEVVMNAGGCGNDDYVSYSVRCLRDETGGGSTSQTLPAVTTGNLSDVTLNSAVCGSEVTVDGGAEVTERGICWSTEPNPTVEDDHTSDGAGTGIFSSSITGLTAGTTYYVRAYATNSVGTAYGEEVSFTTAAEQPQDTCATITLPYSENFDSYTTSTTASTGVEPTCWELVQEDVAMTDANRPQLYYKSSFAHSGNYSLKMGYRGVYAMPALPEDVELNQVQLEMYLRQANAVYQLQVGVWEDNGTFVPVALINNSTTNVEFVEVDFSTYTGSGRKIAFRNVLGGGANYNYSYNYLDDITLSVIGGAVVDEKSCPGTPTVTDIDGNTYSTVKIGEQCWMRENLRTTHYADGAAIPAGGDNGSYTEPYYYDYSSHSLPLEVRGYLYNWPAAMHGASSSSANPSGVQGVCPTGWHLPSDAEWTQLTDYVGSQSEYTCGGDIAKALASTEGWYTSTNNCAVGNDQSVNNATGFSAVPVGICFGSSFGNAGVHALFWSATQSSSQDASGRYLTNDDAGVYRYNDIKSDGRSVRCLRD